MDIKTLDKKLLNINLELKNLNDALINDLKRGGIEYVDLYRYIMIKNNLISRKDKIQYLKAINIE